MTEEELREKLEKLEESRMIQEEKVNGISDSLNKLRERYSKENKKLADIDSEIAKFEGKLYKKVLLKNGIENFTDFEEALNELFNNRDRAKNTESDDAGEE